MSFIYVVGHDKDEKRYLMSYGELRERYHKFVAMKDAEFMMNLVDAAHFACVVCWLKELGVESSIGDRGIVHELIHLMKAGTSDPVIDIKVIRRQFKRLLEL